MQFIAYLNFDGCAREAMDFYAGVFRGRIIERFTFGETPLCAEIPPGQRDRVMHSMLEAGGALLMGADGPPPHDAGGNAVNIVVETPEEAERIFRALAEGGQVRLEVAPAGRARAAAVQHDDRLAAGVGAHLVVVEIPLLGAHEPARAPGRDRVLRIRHETTVSDRNALTNSVVLATGRMAYKSTWPQE